MTPRIASFTLGAMFAVLISSHLAFAAGRKTSSTPYGSISQIVQTRDGRTSCWGVIIRLKKLHFKESIDSTALTITEAKYPRDHRYMMVWHVGRSRRSLSIEFKQGMGDFGSGNYAQIKIDSTAIAGFHMSELEFGISTDLEGR